MGGWITALCAFGCLKPFGMPVFVQIVLWYHGWWVSGLFKGIGVTDFSAKWSPGCRGFWAFIRLWSYGYGQLFLCGGGARGKFVSGVKVLLHRWPFIRNKMMAINT